MIFESKAYLRASGGSQPADLVVGMNKEYSKEQDVMLPANRSRKLDHAVGGYESQGTIIGCKTRGAK